jgi:type I restriction enzyme S subunit
MNLAPLVDVADIFMGQSPPGSTYNSDGKGLPFFQGKTDFGDIYPTVRMYCTEPKRIAEVNDILISVRAPVGPTNLAPIKSAIGRGLAAIRCKENTDVKYLLYFLRYNEPRLAQLGKGSTFEAIGRDELEDMRVPLPPLPEQQRIAAILDRADRLRRTRRYAAQLSETFLQAVFVRMFGDARTNPMGWDVETLEDLETKFDYGTSAKCTSEQRGLPVLRIPNILHSDIDLNDLKYAELPDKEARKLLLAKGELIFVRTNGNPDYVGRCAVFNLDAKYLFASYLIRAKLDTSKLVPLFVQAHLTSRAGRKAMSPFIRTTAGQSNIGTEGLGQIPVPLPPLALQEKFARIVQQFERLRAQQREAERQAEHLFQTLLHRAFSGERVR